MFPFLEFFIFQKIKTKMFLFLTGFAGILPDSVSLFFDLLTVYYLTLILLNQEDKENIVVLFGLCFLRRRTLKDKSNHLKNNKNSQKEISQIWQKLSGKIQSISKEKVIYFLVFIGCIFIGLLPELVMKVIAGGSSIEIISGTYQGGIGYYVGFKTRLPWGAVEYFHTGNFRKRFLEGLEINYFFIAFLISPFLVYFNSRHLSKVLPTLIFFAFLAFYSFWSYYPLLNLKYLLPAFPFCFISLSASLVKLFDFLMSYGKSKGKFLNLPLFSRGGKKIDI
jgi:hypothetical protein